MGRRVKTLRGPTSRGRIETEETDGCEKRKYGQVPGVSYVIFENEKNTVNTSKLPKKERKSQKKNMRKRVVLVLFLKRNRIRLVRKTEGSREFGTLVG